MIERSMMKGDVISLWNTVDVKFFGNEIYKKTETLFKISNVRDKNGKNIPDAMVDVIVEGHFKEEKT